MKNKIQTVLAVLVLGLFSTACSLSGFGPVGGLYTEHKVGVYATSPTGSKTGKACSQSILGLVALGDASVEEAASKAGITKVNNINLESFSLLFVYGTLCTVVQGD